MMQTLATVIVAFSTCSSAFAGASHPPTHAKSKMSLATTEWHFPTAPAIFTNFAAPAAASISNLFAPAPAAASGGPESDAHHAREAASVATQAATVANRVAEHSINITDHAKRALKHALGALHDARVDSNGLDKSQKHSLKKAEAHLREASKKADHGTLKKFKNDEDVQKEKMQAKLDKSKSGATEREELLDQVRELRKQLQGKKHDKDIEKALDELEAQIRESDGSSLDEAKAELERMREVINKLPDKERKHDASESLSKDGTLAKPDATPVEEKGIDIDTNMPYGDLEPFGREDTAQELTEQSIIESDDMVDQLERAEVAEEKRAVFRALTRLRGAAITSYDGVARSQSGNIDEYSKTHKFRKSHPLHHLADEESDVAKWAFPDNADLLQLPNHGTPLEEIPEGVAGFA